MKIALALSGGGARCLAQLGYIEVLRQRLGIEIAALSGSSGGAIAAAFLALGYESSEILAIIQKFPFHKIRFNLHRGTLFCHASLHEELRALGFTSFEACKVPLFVTLTDYETSETHYVHNGDLARAVLASSALLPLFCPIEIDRRSYIDGGIKDNLPLKPLQTQPHYKVGINVNPPDVSRFGRGLLANYKRACYMMLGANIEASIPLADSYVVIEGCQNFGILERRSFATIYELGKRRALEDMQMWEEICSKNS